MVQLALPPETELKVLIDFVSQRLKVRFLYDETISNQKISVRAPGPIPADSLMDVLESALKMKGFALVDAEVEGWKRIEKVDDLSKIAQPGLDPAMEKLLGTKVLTQTFLIKHMKPEEIKTIVEPFLTKQGANTIVLADQNLLIITDYATNLERIAGLIEKIDQAGPERKLEFYEVKNLPAAELGPQISRSLSTQKGEEAVKVDISIDERTNQLLIIGEPEQIKAVLKLAEKLDVALGQRTEIYSFRYVNAERIDRLLQDIFDPLTVSRFYRSAIDSQDNLLIATGTEEIHEKLKWLKEQMDVETKKPGSAVQIYKLKFADAQEVLNTMRAIQGQSSSDQPSYRRGVSPLGRGGVGAARNNGELESPIDFVPGPNIPETPGTQAPVPLPWKSHREPNHRLFLV
ncbi:MAG: secretin N-terminal domain-containing protein [Planctomycetaceae bacterium]